MKEYIGVKKVEAEEMTKGEYYKLEKNEKCDKPNEEGYLVKYDDGCTSWSPKGVFEKYYLDLQSETTEMVGDVAQADVGGNKQLLKLYTLTGFEELVLFEKDEEGEVVEKILTNRIGDHMRFLWAWATNGLNYIKKREIKGETK